MKKWRYKNSNKYYGEKLSKLVDVIKFSKLNLKNIIIFLVIQIKNDI